jgi:hypothetical protein
MTQHRKRFVAVLAVLALLAPAKAAHAADISGSVTYQPSGATVGTFIAASRTIATFSPEAPLVDGDRIVLRFPAGTSLDASSIRLSDFTVQQAASGTSQAGSPTAPSGLGVGSSLLSIRIPSQMLSHSGDSDGLGVVTAMF